MTFFLRQAELNTSAAFTSSFSSCILSRMLAIHWVPSLCASGGKLRVASLIHCAQLLASTASASSLSTGTRNRTRAWGSKEVRTR